MGTKNLTNLKKTEFKDLTTFRVGGSIDHYIEVSNDKEISGAVDYAKENNLEIFILGEGSDILVNDTDFKGLVIRYIGKKVEINGDLISAEAGVNWDELVNLSIQNNLQGIECLSGIPGTVGASPIQNIGAYGQELKDVFVALTAYDIEQKKLREFNKEESEFMYRESFFKKGKNWQKYIITNVTLKLNKSANPQIRYDSLRNYLSEKNINKPTLKEVRDAVIEIRTRKFENPKEVGNAGSFFKNPVVNESIAKELIEKYPEIPHRIQEDGKYKLSAGWFIEKSGWKGKRYKGAGVSPNHALVLINPEGKAKAQDVFELSEKIIEDVFSKFGIKLEREVQLINFESKSDLSKIAILGYGLEGKDLENYFVSKGLTPTILDQKLDKNYLKNLSSFDVIYRSPGVYRFLPEILEAEKKGVKISSAISLFFENCRSKIIGVTGTKGKGTTSTLIYEILKKSGYDVRLAGNIGKPFLELLPKLNKDSWVVLELSSFQLIDMKLSPHIAVVLNITSDHMDWHKSQGEYVDAKKSIVKWQSGSDFALLNQDYEVSRNFKNETKGEVIFFSKNELEEKYKKGLLLRGEHNLENISAAVAVAKILEINEDIILETIKNFKGLQHRLELVGDFKGIKFYNDSFATGPQPSIAAINSFIEPETLILGGSDKGLDYSELGNVINDKENVKNIILIGEIRNEIKKHIRGKNIFDLGTENMKEIVKKALEVTEKAGVVILSPAAASFDMFENYKDRGNQFKKAILNLNNE